MSLPVDSEQKLIESLYDITIDPEKFDELFSFWESEFVDLPGNGSDENGAEYVYGNRQNVSQYMEGHIKRASAIFELTNLDDYAVPTVKQLVDADPLPTLVLSKSREVLLINAAAIDFFNLKARQKLNGNRFNEGDLGRVEEFLDNLHNEKTDQILAIIQSKDKTGAASLLFALTKIHDIKSDQDYLQISVVQTVWNQQVGNTIQKAFKLSDAELDIAKRFIAGQSLPEIADAKSRSINTIRTQSKALFRKTKLKTQTELVRLFSALQNYGDNAGKEAENFNIEEKIATSGTKHYLTRENGRKLYYETYGDPNGQPVLFMHALINGTQLSRYVISYLYAHKIKFISPHREGFGNSECYQKQDVMDNFVKDMEVILEAENVDKFKIIGSLFGSFYAYHLANKLQDRVLKIRSFNSHMPMESNLQFTGMTPQMKVLAYTSAYFPQFFPFLLRSTAVHLKKYGSQKMAEKYYRGCPSDYVQTQDPELSMIIKDGFECAFRYGAVSAAQHVSNSLKKNWMHLLAESTVPIELFHGDVNSFTPLKYVRKIVDKYDHISLQVVEGGELLLYAQADRLLADL